MSELLQLPRNVDLHECFSMIMHARMYCFHHVLFLSIIIMQSFCIHYRKTTLAYSPNKSSVFRLCLSVSEQWHFAHSVLLNHQNHSHTSSQPAVCYLCSIYSIANYVQILSWNCAKSVFSWRFVFQSWKFKSLCCLHTVTDSVISYLD